MVEAITHQERTFGDTQAAITLYYLLKTDEAAKLRRQITKILTEYNGALRIVGDLRLDSQFDKKCLHIIDALFHQAVAKLNNARDTVGPLVDHRAYTYAMCVVRTTRKKYRCIFNKQERHQAVRSRRYQDK